MDALRRFCMLLLLCACAPAFAAEPAKFALRNGDRVILLGNTLIEREQAYGYWEALFTTAFMDQEVKFRNLGWSGDTVFAESRGIFDAPAVGYERMMEQLRELKPTVVILGYGGNEAYGGQSGLKRFLAQLGKLLGDIERIGARIAVISPIAHESFGGLLPDSTATNAKIEIYVKALAGVATEKGYPFVDLFHVTKRPGERWTDNQLHLTELGYRQTARAISQQLKLPVTERTIEFTLKPPTKKSVGADVSVLNGDDQNFPFLVTGDRLGVADFTLTFRGLPAGRHSLIIDKQAVKAATADEWSKGITIDNGPDSRRYAELRAAIVDKNLLYFHRWRPQNVTYLFGFRKHEQGQNAKEVFQFDKLVAEAETKIGELKFPDSHLNRMVLAPKEQ